MTVKETSWPLARPASVAGRAALFIVVTVIGLPVWLALVVGIALFSLLRPLLILLLTAAFVGAIAVAAYFAVWGHDSDAIRAVTVALLSGAGLAAVTVLADRLGLEQRTTYPAPPWWWCV